MKSFLLYGVLFLSAIFVAPGAFAESGSAGEALTKATSALTEKAHALPPIVNEALGGGNLPLLFALLAVVPALLIAATCYVRVITVLSLLRQAIGLAQIPSTQILAILSFLLTFLVMTPTWTRVYREAWVPFSQEQIDFQEAVCAGDKVQPRIFSKKLLHMTQGQIGIGDTLLLQFIF